MTIITHTTSTKKSDDIYRTTDRAKKPVVLNRPTGELNKLIICLPLKREAGQQPVINHNKRIAKHFSFYRHNRQAS